MTRFKKLAGLVWEWIKKHWKLSLFLVVILCGVIFWQMRHANSNGKELKFVKPEYKDLTKVLEVSGKVDAKEKARLRFIAGGKVTYIGAQEGDWVKKWQTIAVIDQASLQKSLQQDLNNYMKERWDWENTQDDIKDRAIETTEQRSIDQEQWDLDNKVLDVEIQDIAIKNTVLSSPFAGILTVSPTTVAGVQLLGTDYFELVNPETLVFRAEVDEVDISSVKQGQKADIYLDAYPDEPHTTQVSYVSYTSNTSSTGTVFVVEFPINSDDLNYYRIGMNGDVEITVDKRMNVMSIPLIATKERDDKVYVDVKTGEGQYEERQIETGIETDEEIEVVSGLSVDDEVLLPD